MNDFEHKWSGREADARIIFESLAQAGVDYIHTTEFEAWQPAFGNSGRSLAALAGIHSGLPVIANGSLHDPDRALEVIAGGAADIVSLGRGALTHADWPDRVRQAKPLSEFDRGILEPLADLASADARRNALLLEAT